MSLTSRELHRHCMPFLDRSIFRFNMLRGLIDEKTRDALELAKEFSNPEKDLKLANFRLGREILKGLGKSKPASGEIDYKIILQKLLENGIVAKRGNPKSVGLILEMKEIEGAAAYFLLNELKDKNIIHSGRIGMPLAGHGKKTVIIYMADTCVRLAENLDLMLMHGRNPDDQFEKDMIRASFEKLESYVSGRTILQEEMPINFVLFIISSRAVFAKLTGFMDNLDSFDEFLCNAINLHIDSRIAHEIAHLKEREANSGIVASMETVELIAHLLQAIYGNTGLALQAMLTRGVDFSKIAPEMTDDIRQNGARAFLKDASYLREHMCIAADRIFQRISGKKHNGAIDTNAIVRAQTSDYIKTEQIPLIKAAITNPSARKRITCLF